MTTFCAEHQISRKTFYAIRARARIDGAAAAHEPRSRRPKTSPAKLSDEVKEQALGVRAALESSGLDHGPVSVHDKMRAMGLEVVPSVASLARIFREARAARAGAEEEAEAAWCRFVYPAPNACWQLDATEYVLTRGRKCVMFQLIDDHSRYALASHVAWGETAEAAIIVFDKATSHPGRSWRSATAAVGQRVRAQPVAPWAGPTRRPRDGPRAEPITGKPYKPTTQGKNERFHQTLFHYLDKQPLAETLDELQA